MLSGCSKKWLKVFRDPTNETIESNRQIRQQWIVVVIDRFLLILNVPQQQQQTCKNEDEVKSNIINESDLDNLFNRSRPEPVHIKTLKWDWPKNRTIFFNPNFLSAFNDKTNNIFYWSTKKRIVEKVL